MRIKGCCKSEGTSLTSVLLTTLIVGMSLEQLSAEITVYEGISLWKRSSPAAATDVSMVTAETNRFRRAAISSSFIMTSPPPSTLGDGSSVSGDILRVRHHKRRTQLQEYNREDDHTRKEETGNGDGPTTTENSLQFLENSEENQNTEKRATIQVSHTADDGDSGREHRKAPSAVRSDEKWCRCRGQYLPESLFKSESCAWCYHFVLNSPKIFNPGKKWNLAQLDTTTWDENNFTLSVLSNGSHTLFANHDEEDSFLHRSFVTLEQSRKWTACCQSAHDCCEETGVSYEKTQEVDNSTCPATWDGWQCWPEVWAGKEAEAPCPTYIYFETQPPASTSCKPLAKKMCESDGRWYRRGPKGYEKEWSNYTTCSRLEFYLTREYVHIGSYAVSIAALIPALVIFNSYKQLRISRIILHQHLFLSLLMNAVSVIVFKSTMIVRDFAVKEGDLSESQVLQNGVLCRILYLSTRYFRVTNYAWMLCEGYYLHKLVAVAFAQQPSLKMLYVVGWVFPIIDVAVYAGLRLGIRGNEDCWIHPVEAFEWTTNFPCLLSLLVNVIFLGNIIRVLLTKLRASHHLETPQYRKAVKATLVLVPLFGIHFIITMYRPPEVCNELYKYYDYARNTVDGIQGFLVAALFCFFNGEVLHLLRRSYNGLQDYYRPLSLDSRGRRATRGSVFHGRSVMSTHVASSAVESPRVLIRSEAVVDASDTSSLAKPTTAAGPMASQEAAHLVISSTSTRPESCRWSCALIQKPPIEDSNETPDDSGMPKPAAPFLFQDIVSISNGNDARRRNVGYPSAERTASDGGNSVDCGYSSHERIPMLELTSKLPVETAESRGGYVEPNSSHNLGSTWNEQFLTHANDAGESVIKQQGGQNDTD